MHRRSSSVGVRELRQNLSVYLDRVKRGESLTVTEHGAVVAELRPVVQHEGLIERLIREGLAVGATRQIADLPKPLKLKMSGKRSLSALLDEQREDRF